MKENKYIKNGYPDIQNCVMFDPGNKQCTGLKEIYCLTQNYDCPFFKDGRKWTAESGKLKVKS